MELPKSDGGDFELCPAGTYSARCNRFIDLGSHEQTYLGESKGLKRLVIIGWELPLEKMKDGRPFAVSKRYTWSTHEKANMRKDLESWRGRKFVDSDFGPGGFNVKKLLGVAATLGVTHDEREGKTYVNVSSVSPAMKGVEIPVLINPSTYLALVPNEFDREIYEGLSEGLKQKIAQSPEYQSIFAPKTPQNYGAASGSFQRPLNQVVKDSVREFAPLDDLEDEPLPF